MIEFIFYKISSCSSGERNVKKLPIMVGTTQFLFVFEIKENYTLVIWKKSKRLINKRC